MCHGGRQQVPHVVELVVMQVRPAFLVGQLDLGADVPIIFLCRGDVRDVGFQRGTGLLVPGKGVDVGEGLQPLVAVAVTPLGALVRTGLRPCRLGEVVQGGTVGRVVQNLFHGVESTVAAERETFAPEAFAPLGLSGGQGMKPETGTVVHAGVFHWTG